MTFENKITPDMDRMFLTYVNKYSSKKQTLDDAYAVPANFLEIDVINPITHGVANKRYTDYEVRLKVH